MSSKQSAYEGARYAARSRGKELAGTYTIEEAQQLVEKNPAMQDLELCKSGTDKWLPLPMAALLARAKSGQKRGHFSKENPANLSSVTEKSAVEVSLELEEDAKEERNLQATPTSECTEIQENQAEERSSEIADSRVEETQEHVFAEAEEQGEVLAQEPAISQSVEESVEENAKEMEAASSVVSGQAAPESVVAAFVSVFAWIFAALVVAATVWLFGQGEATVAIVVVLGGMLGVALLLVFSHLLTLLEQQRWYQAQIVAQQDAVLACSQALLQINSTSQETLR